MPSIKKISKVVAALAILFVAFGPLGVLEQTPVARAAVGGECFTKFSDGSSVAGTLDANNNCITAKGIGGSSAVNGGTVTGSNGQSLDCNGFTQCLANVVYYIGPGFASWIASTVATFFDFVVGMSLNSTAYALDFLTTSWTLVLSLANMFFIFILIYTAFVIMLKAETARTMQILAWVIAIALVVNFSFFFTRVIIDAGNILGTQFYNAIVLQNNGGIPINSVSGTANAPSDITANLMSAIGVEQLLGSNSFNLVQQVTGTNAWGTLLVITVIYLSVAIMFWIIAAALLMAGIKFFLRIVGLWFVIIASPLAFVSQTLTKTKPFFDMWLRALISLAFYPAVFLFMFYVLNLFVANLSNGNLINAIFTSNGANSASNAAANPYPLVVAIANVSIRVGFIIVMLYIMLKVADWLMEQAGGMASTLMNRGSSTLLGAGFRSAANIGAFAGRNVAGRAAYRAADSTGFKNWAGRSAIGNALWRGTSSLSKANFDVRNAPGGSVIKKAASKVVGDINVGKATANSYDKSVSEREKAIKKRAEALKASDMEKRRAQEKYESENKEKHEADSAYRTARMASRDQQLDNLRNSKATYLASATNKNGPTPFDQRINELVTEQASERKAQADANKKFTTGGEDAVKAAQTQRITALADRYGKANFRNVWSPSVGSIKGATAAMKVIKGKSNTDEIIDKLKEEIKKDAGNAEPAASSAPSAPSLSPAPAVAHGGGGSAFTKDAGTAHALEKMTEKLHGDLTKVLREQHKTTEALHSIPTHTPAAQPLNTKKIVEQVSNQVADKLQNNTTPVANIQKPADQIKPEEKH